MSEAHTNPAASGFQRIQGSTECLFASRARLWYAQAGNPARTAEGSVPALLEQFLALSEAEGLDGLVLAYEANCSASVSDLSRTTRRVLTGLSQVDPAGRDSMRNVQDTGWWFSYAGHKLFVLTFGTCYPPSSSRYGFGSSSTYIVLQPAHSFSRHLPGPRNVARAERLVIRERYRKAGRPYDLTLTLSPHEAHRYVKPVTLGEPPVRWWEEPVG